MPLTEMVVMVAMVSAFALAFVALLRLFATLSTHKTIRKAVEVNQGGTDVLLAMLAPKREESGDDRLAIVLIAVGIAMAGASIIIGDPGIVRFGIAAALFPLLVGAALWLRFCAVERARPRDTGE